MTTNWFNTWLQQQIPQTTAETPINSGLLCCPLDFLGVIEISGVDAEKFLQGQLTCDVKNVTPTEASLGAHCNLQGRMVSSFYLLRSANNYVLILPSSVLPTALAHLSHYARFSRVKLRDISLEWSFIGVMGQNAEKFLMAQGGIPPCQPLQVSALQEGLLFRMIGPEPRYLLHAAPTILQTLWQNAIQNGALVASHQAWTLADLTAGFVAIQLEISGKFTPHDLNYPNWQAVSFTKGCYLGQEIVARIHYRGQLKQHLYSLCGTLKQPIAPFADIVRNPEHIHVGHIAAVYQTTTGEFQALAVLNDKACEEGLILMIAEEIILNCTIGYI